MSKNNKENLKNGKYKIFNLTTTKISMAYRAISQNTCISNVCGTLTINQEINKELLEKQFLCLFLLMIL